MDRILTPPVKTMAAVDLGSNSFHMIIARVVEGGLHTLDRMREMVRLGGGLDAEGNLDNASRIRAIHCLERFGQRLRGMPPGSVRAVGTNTLRQARNASAFLRQAREALGHPIEIIAGREEARLIYLGVSHSLPDTPNNRLVIDIGGGSTELIIGESFEPKHRESLVMGCVSYSLRFFSQGILSPSAMRAAETAAAQELQVIRPKYRNIGWQTAIGSSGTINAIQDILRANRWSNDGITLQGLQTLRQALLAAGNLAALNLPGLQPERVPVLPGGVAILLAIFECLDIKQLTVSDGALREGLLYDLLGRLLDEDVRDRTIRALIRRYHVDLPQARRVERTALALLAQGGRGNSYTLPADEHHHMLSWAALLHELGLTIAHSGYHRHGAYVVDNSDMPGFSRPEQQFLAALIRGHRRRLPMELFEALPEGRFEAAWRLCVLLRLAVLLHRSRSHDTTLPELNIHFKPDKRSLRLSFPEGWMDCNPLTQADLNEEVMYLKAAGIKLRFE
ncbi:Exopolyphosphatase [Gammaproteobacteria bacterium]